MFLRVVRLDLPPVSKPTHKKIEKINSYLGTYDLYGLVNAFDADISYEGKREEVGP
jgi:hypothetical protein